MFYDTYRSLCLAVGKTPTAVALELGLSKGNVSYWKKNGTAPQGPALYKIADYFGVSTDFLLTGKEGDYKAYETADDDIEIFECIELLKKENIRRIVLRLKRASDDDLLKIIGLIDIVVGSRVETP